MTLNVEENLRGPHGYDMGHATLRELKEVKVWPTLLNFELWLHVLADPESRLALEVNALLGAGEPITDALAEELGRAYLPRARLEAQVSDAGDVLSEELGAVALAMQEARGSTGEYSKQLEQASQRLRQGLGKRDLPVLLKDLTEATERVQSSAKSLEARLAESATEVRKLRECLVQARQEAAVDGLSSLANRRAFDDELKRACADADARGGSVSVALLDIDHFKPINDAWGHQTGDQVICFVASAIGRIGTAPRFAARFGGDEFAMIFPDEPAGAVEAALREALKEISSRRLRRRTTNEPLGEITLSAGFAERRAHEPPAMLIERADSALYASKRGGRNRVSGPGAPEAVSAEVRVLPIARPPAATPATVRAAPTARSWS